MKDSKPSFALISAGYLILLVAAYFDNLRGPILPVLSQELGLNFGQNGSFIATGLITGIVTNLALLYLGKRCSDRQIAITATIFALLTAAMAYAVSSFTILLVMAAGIGSSLALMGTVCNLLVVEGSPVSIRARMLAGLHTMYGVGSFGAGVIASYAMANDINWRHLFFVLVPINVLLTIFFLAIIPGAKADCEAASAHGRLDRRQLLVVLIFILYVAGESGTSMWLSNFLVKARSIDPVIAAERVSGFFAVLTLSRAFCFICGTGRHERALLVATLLVPIACFAFGYLWLDWSFALVGLVGPFFPLFLARVSREFVHSWKSLTVAIFLGNQIGLAILNLALGEAADVIGINYAFLAPPTLLVGALCLICLHFYLPLPHQQQEQA